MTGYAGLYLSVQLMVPITKEFLYYHERDRSPVELEMASDSDTTYVDFPVRPHDVTTNGDCYIYQHPVCLSDLRATDNHHRTLAGITLLSRRIRYSSTHQHEVGRSGI